MKLLICAIFACLAASTIGEKNEISFVSPTLTRAIESNDTRLLEEEITALLEWIRTTLTDGVPELGIPSFDPLEIADLKIDLDALGIPGASGFLNFKDLVLDGTMGFEATHIKGTMVAIGGIGAKIEVTLLFDKISFQSKYDGDLEVSGIHVFGAGDVTLDVTQLQLEVVLLVRLQAPSSRIYLESMQFLPSVENVDIEFTGLFNDPEQSQQVNDLLNSVLTNWINEKGQDISNIIEAIVKYIINNLGQVTTTEAPTTEAPTTLPPTVPPPFNDCENPSGANERISCAIKAALEELRINLQANPGDPLVVNDVSLGGIVGGTWDLEKLSVSEYTEFTLGYVRSNFSVEGGLNVEFDIPFTWNFLELDITQNGDFDIFGMNIKMKNSKIMGFLRNFDFSIYANLQPMPNLVNLRLKPTIAENDIKAICAGIFINDVDASDMLTNFLNNDLAKFLSKHGEDLGDIIAGIILELGKSSYRHVPIVAELFNTFDKIQAIIQKEAENYVP